MLQSYLKFIAQVLSAVLVAVVAALAGNGQIDTSEAINIVIVGLGALAVLGAGELPAGVWAHTKTYLAVATAGAVFIQSAITDGISAAEWVQLAVVLIGAATVTAVPGPLVDTVGRHADRNTP